MATSLPPLVPLKVLFGNPEKTSPDLSPDATRLAYLAPSVGKDVLNVWVKTIGKDDDRQVTNDTHRGIRSFFWAECGEFILYLQDVGGNENWHLYRQSLEAGKEAVDLTPGDEVGANLYPNRFLRGACRAHLPAPLPPCPGTNLNPKP